MTTKGKGLDLASFDIQGDHDKGCEIEINADGEPLGIFITIVGQYSKAYTDHNRKVTNQVLRTSQHNRQRGKNEETLTVDKLKDKGTELLIACTVSWRMEGKKTILWEGEELEFTPKNARTLYESNKIPFLRKQVDDAITDDTLFMKS